MAWTGGEVQRQPLTSRQFQPCLCSSSDRRRSQSFEFWQMLGNLILKIQNFSRQRKNSRKLTEKDSFYRAMLRSYGKLSVRTSVCLSVCLSVKLRYCDHTSWNSSKIMSPLVSLGCSLFATPTWRVYSRGNTRNFCPNRGECWKSGFERSKSLIYLKRSKIGPRLLLRTNRKSYTRFRLVQKRWP